MRVHDADLKAPAPARTNWYLLWRQTPQSIRIGAVILLMHLIVAATGPLWAPYGYAQMGAGIPLSGMSWSTSSAA